MNFQDRFDTAIHILLENHITQKQIAASLESMGVRPSSASALSRAKSEVYKGSQDGVLTRKKRGELSELQLKPLVVGLEKILKEKLRIVFDSKRNLFVQDQTNTTWEAIYVDSQQVPELPTDKRGILNIYEVFPNEYILSEIENAKKEIRIIQTYLTGAEHLVMSLKKALKNDVKVKILLLSPGLEGARLREKGLSTWAVDVESNIKENLKELEKLNADDNFEVKQYNELPGFNLFAVDDCLLIGWYWFQKYAIEGCYLEIANDNSFPLAKDVNLHWNKLWRQNELQDPTRIMYKCHYIRSGKYENFNLWLFPSTKVVEIRGTPSGDIYRGSMINDKGYCAIRAETIKSGAAAFRAKRFASFLVNIGRDDTFSRQEIAVAVYSNISPSGRAFGNIMILEKTNDKDENLIREESKINFIKNYLEEFNSEIKIHDSNVYNKEGLKKSFDRKSNLRRGLVDNYLSKLKGEYFFYTLEENDNEEKFIQPRTLKIYPNGVVKFRGNTEISEGKVIVLNTQNIAIQKVRTVAGSVSYFYVLQPINKKLDKLSGYYCGISLFNLPKQSRIYMVKTPDIFKEKGFNPIKIYSGEFEELCKQHNKFRELFAGH